MGETKQESDDAQLQARDDLSYILDEQVGHILRRAQQRHTMIFSERMPGDITPTQFAALARLDQWGPCSQNHLGRLAAIDVATIKGVIDRLRERGLVTTRPDLADRRRSVLELTDEGRAFLNAAYVAAHQVTEQTLEPLSAREREQFLKLLSRISQ
jgi:MarR family transcriptional regulator, lower aerobic nicotinate degradation pathway regulator